MIEIDGSFGEGGGQILRTALSLSCLRGLPFRMFNIRTKRRKPGLMPQHLMAVKSLALISGASVKGDSIGSTQLFFEPKEVKSGDYYFDIGTAGSTSLLMQALLLPLVFSRGQSSLTLKGGTHVPMSPPFHYIKDAFISMLKRLGIDISAEISSYGFYPKGGGKVRFLIEPAKTLRHMNFIERGDIISIKGLSGVGNLSLSIAQRQKDSTLKALGSLDILPEIETVEVNSIGQGTFVFLSVDSEGSNSGFSALGQRGKRAETVGQETAEKFLDYYRTGSCLDPHMADQLIPYLALIKDTIGFTTSKVTGHLLTNLWVTEKFLGIKYEIEGEKGSPGTVIIRS
ncbi:MAG: RNA 3'-phosphate cyclase [Nitrospirae bacterium]|nr:RNA 3'-phosphate cyclase [Nitrospirota bacterium]